MWEYLMQVKPNNYQNQYAYVVDDISIGKAGWTNRSNSVISIGEPYVNVWEIWLKSYHTTFETQCSHRDDVIFVRKVDMILQKIKSNSNATSTKSNNSIDEADVNVQQTWRKSNSKTTESK